jgi:hypothetical protein
MGVVQCDGCFNRFCSIHFSEHRQCLDFQFEQLCRDRNILAHEIKNQSSKINQSQLRALLHKINQWELQALKSVKQTVNRARKRINELITSKAITTQANFDQLSKELRRRKAENDYFEHDIKQLSEKLKKIQISLDLHRSPIKMVLPPIEWNPLFQIEAEREIRPGKEYFSSGTLLNQEHQCRLNEFYGKENQTWQLVYKGTRDGFSSTDFHRCCDKKGATLTVIQSTSGYLFGGYTSIKWESHEDFQWSVDMNAFLFTLTNPNKISPTKYRINTDGRNAIGCKESVGPTFGKWDMCIHSNSNENGRSSILFPSNYIDSTGKGRLTFTGSHYFTVADIEVYHPKHA